MRCGACWWGEDFSTPNITDLFGPVRARQRGRRCEVQQVDIGECAMLNLSPDDTNASGSSSWPRIINYVLRGSLAAPPQGISGRGPAKALASYLEVLYSGAAEYMATPGRADSQGFPVTLPSAYLMIPGQFRQNVRANAHVSCGDGFNMTHCTVRGRVTRLDLVARPVQAIARIPLAFKTRIEFDF